MLLGNFADSEGDILKISKEKKTIYVENYTSQPSARCFTYFHYFSQL